MENPQRMPESFGRYRLIERLGTGGMAQVFRAVADGEFHRPIVIKRILPELSDHAEFVRLLQHEARLSARLDHRAIVRVYELGCVANEHYLAMELVDGLDLASLLEALQRRGRKLDEALACYLVHEVASALAYAHTHEIIHRDISPSNILVSKSGEVKLCDFGIAKAAGGIRNDKTRTGVVKGKIGYMSPEQADARPIDARTDLFSLGIVFWEMLSGRRLFRGEDDLHTLRLVREAEAAPPACDPRIAAIVMKLLARQREDRFSGAAEVVAAIDPLLHEARAGAPGLQQLVEEVGQRPAAPGVGSEMLTVARAPAQAETAQHQEKRRRRWPWAAVVLVIPAALAFWPRPVGSMLGTEEPPILSPRMPRIVHLPKVTLEEPVASEKKEPRRRHKSVVKRSGEIHDPFSER